MMIIDARDLSYAEAFRTLRNIIYEDKGSYEVMVYIRLEDHDKCNLLKGFSEILLGCKADISATEDLYYLTIASPDTSIN